MDKGKLGSGRDRGGGPGSRVALGVSAGWLVSRSRGESLSERDVLIACG